MKYFLSLLSILWCLAAPLNAATITAISPSFEDVSAAVAAANRGDTVEVPEGSAVWTDTLTLPKGINLLGSGRDSTSITNNGIFISIVPDSIAIANDETIRVEGFTFDGNNVSAYFITVEGSEPTATKSFNNLAIGNNQFKNSTTVTSNSGVILSRGQVRGAIFKNIFDRCNVIVKNIGNDDVIEWSNGHFPFAYGNADNLFFEGNVIQYSSSFSGQDPGWIESGQGARIVVRYNAWHLANSNMQDLYDGHGFQNFPGNGQTGTMIQEYYGNTVDDFGNSSFGAFRWIAHRGSWLLAFNNIATNTTGAAQIAIMQYGPLSGEAGGSGCREDIPVTPPGAYIPEINNTYIFNNQDNGIIRNAFLWFPDGCGRSGENIGFYNYDPQFDGSVGIGRGTTPPTMDATDGVAYWVCSVVTPTTDPAILQNGHLFKRENGVWVDRYRPYTYPHPLAGATPTPAPLFISGVIRYCDNPMSPGIPNATVILSGDQSETATTDNEGAYTFSGLPSGSYRITPMLLANSVAINTSDVVAIQRNYLGILPMNDCQSEAADVDLDGRVTTSDVVAMQRFILGMAHLPWIGTFKFSPENRDYKLQSNQTTQDYDTILYGDVAPPYAY